MTRLTPQQLTITEHGGGDKLGDENRRFLYALYVISAYESGKCMSLWSRWYRARNSSYECNICGETMIRKRDRKTHGRHHLSRFSKDTVQAFSVLLAMRIEQSGGVPMLAAPGPNSDWSKLDSLYREVLYTVVGPDPLFKRSKRDGSV